MTSISQQGINMAILQSRIYSRVSRGEIVSCLDMTEDSQW